MSDIAESLRACTENGADPAILFCAADEIDKLRAENARQAERIAELDAETGVLRTKYEAFSDQQHTIDAQSAVISMAKTAIRKLQENTDDYYDSAREAAQFGNEVLAAINALPSVADKKAAGE